MDINGTISQNLKLAREEAGVTQTEAASRLGLASHSAVSDMEGGRRRVTASELAALAGLYGKSMDWFFDPEACKEGFVALARAQEDAPSIKEALREAERFLDHFLLLRELTGAK